MNTGKIVVSRKVDKYRSISNEMSQSTSLMIDEKGLLLYILSLPNDWVLYRSNLYKVLPDSPGTIDRVFKSLQSKGYIISSKTTDDKGRFTGWDHVVFDEPQVRHEDLPMSGFTEVGESAPIQSTNNTTNCISSSVLDKYSNSTINKEMDSFLENDEETKTLTQNEKAMFQYAVVEMDRIFVAKNPIHLPDKNTDYTAYLKIAYLIARDKGWMKSECLGAKSQELMKIWAEYVDFIVSVDWFAEKPPHWLSQPSNWQSVHAKKKLSANKKPIQSDYQNEYERKKAEYYAKSKERQKSEME